MSLDPITFPTSEPSRLLKLICAVGSFERRHPMAAMAISWAALGGVLVLSAAVSK